MNFFRWLFIYLCGVLFQLIPPLYKLFYDLAGATFFQQDIIKTFSKNLYVLLSVVMLFAFAVKALESIINPDLLFDSKKGFTGVLKRSLISLLLIVIIPFAFDKFYEYQNEIMSKSLIEKMILGVNIEGGDGENTADKTGAGQMMAGLTLQSVLYLKEDASVYEDMEPTIAAYDAAVGEDIGEIFKFAPDINEKYDGVDGEEYIFEFHWFPALIGCIFIIYALAVFCLDTAERVIRLGFLQLTAPISVIAYVYGGNDILKNWASETAKAAFSVFLRIAGLAFLIFVLSGIQDFTAGIVAEDGIYKTLIQLLIIIGTLMFIKEIPKTVEKIFGVSIGNKGGIKGRLGNMVGADVAKKALNAAAIGGAAAVGGVALAAKGFGKGIDQFAFKGKGSESISNLKNKAGDLMQNTKPGQALTRAGQNISRAGKALSAGVNESGVIKSVQAAQKSFRENPYTKQHEMEENAKFQEDIGVKPGVVLGKNSTLAEAGKDNTRGHYSYDKYMQNLRNNSKLSGAQKNAISGKTDATLKKESIDNFQKAHNDIKDLLDTAITGANSNGDSVLAQQLEDLKKNYNDGKINASQLDSKVKDLFSQGKVSSAFTNDIVGKLNTIDNMLENDKYIKSLNLPNETGGIAGAAIKTAVSSAEGEKTKADEKYDLIYNNASDKDKQRMDKYTGVAETISKQYAYENGKAQGGNEDHYSKIEDSESTVSSDVSSGNVRHETVQVGGHTEHTTASNDAYRNMQNGSSAGSSVNPIPSGYSETPSGIIIPNDVNIQQNSSSQGSNANPIPSGSSGGPSGATSSNDSYSQQNSSPASSNVNPVSSGYSGGSSDTTSSSNSNVQQNTTVINNNNTTSGNQNIDFSELGSVLKRNTDEINSNINNRTSELKNDIGSARDNINKNLRSVNDNLANNINKAKNDISETVKEQTDGITQSLNDFFADNNDNSNNKE